MRVFDVFIIILAEFETCHQIDESGACVRVQKSRAEQCAVVIGRTQS
jgi:hypothetical protein